MYKCEHCGEYFTREEMVEVDTGHYVCDDCYYNEKEGLAEPVEDSTDSSGYEF